MRMWYVPVRQSDVFAQQTLEVVLLRKGASGGCAGFFGRVVLILLVVVLPLLLGRRVAKEEQPPCYLGLDAAHVAEAVAGRRRSYGQMDGL